MLEVHDIRETRVYREAKEEGREEGREEGIEQERRRSILKLAARKMPAGDIAEALGLDVELVRKTMAKGATLQKDE